jgi:CRP/FNR family cyclic AMP-dependent transcriptional regulator
MAATARALARFDLFAALDDEARQWIASRVYERSFEAGQTILFTNEPGQAVYLVVSGEMRAHRLSIEGREYVLDYIGPGQFFNVVAALDGGASLANVEVMSNAVVYLIPGDRFRQMMDDHQEVTAAVLRYLANRMRYLCDTVENLALHTVRTRLARFLLARASNSSYRSRQWTQEEIAAHIGTVRDVVGRTLRSFAREGLVRRQRGRLVVTDLVGLKREAMRE